MKPAAIKLALLATLSTISGTLRAQLNFEIGERPVQIHSFMSQGFAYSNGNNYLTMETRGGSFDFTDGGLNASMRVTDQLRIGAQVYVRDIAQLGHWHLQLDWAVADYKLKDWLGIRGGKVKTTFGLHNDTQDMEFLHSFALLPQSIYPTDLRDALIGHVGGDVYGEIPLKRLGSLSYTAFAGERQDTVHGGYIYMLESIGIYMDSYGGLQYGADLKWNTPLKGLLLGAAHMNQDITGRGKFILPGAAPATATPYEEHSNKDYATQFSAQYVRGNFRVEGEYRRWWRDQQIFNDMASVTTDTRGWYTAAAYRISKRLELGSYYSRLVPVWAAGHHPPTNHVYDKVVAARVDLNRHWNVKVEGHFMNGNSNGMYPDGFYPQVNPDGLKPKTNLLILRMGLNF